MATFNEATFDFLRDLAANNSKDWFEDNRNRYDAHWKAPALAFIEALAPEMAALSPPLKAEAKINGSLRRINRDVRFSKDKSPYNPSLHLVFWSGAHPNRSPGMHFVLNPDGVGYGTGLYGLSSEQLTRYRDMVVDPVEQKALLAALEGGEEVGCRLGKPDLARLPKGYDGDGRVGELLRYKSLVARTHDQGAEPAMLMGDSAVDWAMAQTRALMPLLRWTELLVI
ncbi:MAG: DUF2461 domain-containing protein [Pseudomonadota bacterium]